MKKEDKQLLVEIGITAANHNMHIQAYKIIAALPLIIKSREDCAITASIIYFGLGEEQKAVRILKECNSEAALGLIYLFSCSGPKHKRSELICRLLREGDDGYKRINSNKSADFKKN